MINKKPIIIAIILILVLCVYTIIDNSLFNSFNLDNQKKTIQYTPYYGCFEAPDLSYLSENNSMSLLLGPFLDKDKNPIVNATISIIFHDIVLTSYTTEVGIVYFDLNFSIPYGTYLIIIEAKGYETKFIKLETGKDKFHLHV